MKILGLISGTSVDGIDTAIVDVPEDFEEDAHSHVSISGFGTYPYPEGVRERILEISNPGGGSVEKICHLNAYLGELFANAACRAVQDAGMAIDEIVISVGIIAGSAPSGYLCERVGPYWPYWFTAILAGIGLAGQIILLAWAGTGAHKKSKAAA